MTVEMYQSFCTFTLGNPIHYKYCSRKNNTGGSNKKTPWIKQENPVHMQRKANNSTRHTVPTVSNKRFTLCPATTKLAIPYTTKLHLWIDQ